MGEAIVEDVSGTSSVRAADIDNRRPGGQAGAIHGQPPTSPIPPRWRGVLAVVAVLAAVSFGVAQGFVLFGVTDPESWSTWVTKWLTVPSLPLLFILLAERVAERPARWGQATAVWAILGGAIVLITANRMEAVSERIGNAAYHRLWPTTLSDAGQTHLNELGGFGAGWTPTGIVVRELIVVVVAAVVCGLAMRRCARLGGLAWAGAVVPLAALAVLVGYAIITPWAFIMDYDFLVGDSVLGGTLFELLFFPAPADPIGAMAIGAAALSMGGLLLVWGRCADHPSRHRVSERHAEGHISL